MCDAFVIVCVWVNDWGLICDCCGLCCVFWFLGGECGDECELQ